MIHQYLKNYDSSYWAGLVGKWHLGHQTTRGCLPTRRGFDSFVGLPYSHEEGWPIQEGFPNAPFPPIPLYENETIIQQPVTLTDLPGIYRKQILSDLDWLSHTKRPFFYHYAFDQPHFPVFASLPYQNKSLRGLYGDAVEEIDASIGMVMDKIRNNNFLRRNTIVVFVSDNGAWVNPNNGAVGTTIFFPLQGGSNAGLRDEKGSTWEGGTRVVASFWGPEKIIPSISFAVASVHDFLPTFLNFADIPLPTDRVIDGFSLVPILNGKNSTSPTTFIHFWRERTLYAIRYKQFKCHFITRPGFGTDVPIVYNPCLLYNLEWNPFETYPLSGTDCAGVLGATTCDDIIEIINNEYTNHVTSFTPPPAQYDAINPIETPCCRGVVTPAALQEAADLGFQPTDFAFWEYLNCTC